MKKKPLAIVGGGSWGTTLAEIAARKGHSILLWVRRDELAEEINDRHTNQQYLPGYPLSEKIKATTDLEQVCTKADTLLLVVPSKGFRAMMETLGEHLCGDHCVVHAAKGLERDTHKTMSTIIREESCVKRTGVLSGPNIAGEIMAGRPSGTVIASHYPEVIEKTRHYLAGPGFRLYSNRDVTGVELGGVMKNIFAIASGILAGLQVGENTKALLLTRGMAEMNTMGKALGAETVTFSGLAGIGDLIATCSSPLSRNFQVGQRLGKGETLAQILDSMFMVAEGVNTTSTILQLARQHRLDLPIAQAVSRILFEEAPPETLLNVLMEGNSDYEIDGLR